MTDARSQGDEMAADFLRKFPASNIDRSTLGAWFHTAFGIGADIDIASQPPGVGPALSALKRYDLVTNYRCGDSIEEMEPSDDGVWIRYEDVEAALSGSVGGQSIHHESRSPDGDGQDALTGGVGDGRIACSPQPLRPVGSEPADSHSPICSVGGLNAALSALSVETPQEQRANALRGAVFQIWSATGAYSHEIPALCKAAIERDNAVLDALLAPPALAAAEERKTEEPT